MSIRLFGALSASAFLVLIFAVACGGSNNNKTNTSSVATAVGTSDAAKTELCNKVDDLQNAVKEVDNLDSNSTVDDAKKAQADVSAALDGVKSAAQSSAANRVSALQTAQQAINNALSSISGSQTLGSAAAILKTQGAALRSALDGLKSDVKCS